MNGRVQPLGNVGHGHVHPRPDGAKARCGGPPICPVCARELAAVVIAKNKQNAARARQAREESAGG